jgi:hypothetical protein
MTIQSSWSDLLVGKGEAIRQSRWRRFLVAIMESRQRKADEVVQDYLRRRFEDGLPTGGRKE